MSRSTLALVIGLALAGLTALPAQSQVLFRMPLSMSDCGSTCSVSAHFDTNRGAGLLDYGCGAWTYAQHDGTDYAVGGFPGMDAGRPVLAAAPGVVIAAHDGEFDRCTTANCGTANYVMIRHSDGKVTWYWHLKKWSVAVQVGQEVSCGQHLGEAGSSGLSTGPHLHFAAQYSQGGAIDDPYRSAGGCGGDASWWVSQGAYGSLPAPICEGQSGFCVGKADGYWCNGDKLTVCGGGAVDTETDCPHGCQSMPPGTPDQCEAAPVTTATVKGVVWDLSVTSDAAAALDLGARLPGTTITSSSGESATTREGDGFWSMEVGPGSHTITATREGYVTASREIEVVAGAEQWASLGLEPEAPPVDDEPGDDEPGDDEPGDDEPGDGDPGDEGPGDEEPAGGPPPTGEAPDGVLTPLQPIAPNADDDAAAAPPDEDELAGESALEVGCRCVGSSLGGTEPALVFGLLLGGALLTRRRRVPSRR